MAEHQRNNVGSLDNSACSDVSVNNEDPFTEGF